MITTFIAELPRRSLVYVRAGVPPARLIRALSSRFTGDRPKYSHFRADTAAADNDDLVIRNDSAHIIAAVAPTLFTNSATAVACMWVYIVAGWLL